MNRHEGYVWEKLNVTVVSMAEGPGPIRERVQRAWFDQLMRLKPDDFEGIYQDLRCEFDEISQVLGSPNADELLSQMNDDEAYVFGKRITGLYDQVSSRFRQWESEQ